MGNTFSKNIKKSNIFQKILLKSRYSRGKIIEVTYDVLWDIV